MAFSEETVKQAFQGAGGRCECKRTVCGHTGRCAKTFTFSQRAPSDQSGWQANHVTSVAAGGSDGLSNCEILCVPCHKKTGSYGG